MAWRKAQRLIAAGARVTIVAPDVLPELAAVAAGASGATDAVDAATGKGAVGILVWRRRSYESGEVADYRLVFAATSDPVINAQVAAEATAAGCLVNVTDDPDASTFYLPAQIRRGALQLNIATDGGAPFVARRLRERWESWLGPEWAAWLQSAARFRAAVLREEATPERQQQLFDRFAAETIASDGRTVRDCSESEWRGWLGAADSGESKNSS